VTDAGTPGISDPGNELIFFLLQQEPTISVKSIPGASSLSAILSICAFNINSNIFLGFMPKKGQSKLFEKLEKIKLPFVYFDSPHRLIKNLEALRNYFGSDIEVFIGRELTKMHEETFRGTISEVLKDLGKSNPKGEVVVVVNLK
jgi:16S rRNA (cytidine1402-2'-O)-methyltransferase